MTCREAQQMVMPYINHQLSDEDLEAFLLHVKGCPDCREELEIYFNGTYDIPGALKRTLEQSWDHVRHVHVLTVLRYVFGTLSALSLTVMFLLQMRIWWQAGMF